MRNLALASLVALHGCLPELEGVEHGEITTIGSMDTDEPSQVPEEIQAVTDEFKPRQPWSLTLPLVSITIARNWNKTRMTCVMN